MEFLIALCNVKDFSFKDMHLWAQSEKQVKKENKKTTEEAVCFRKKCWSIENWSEIPKKVFAMKVKWWMKREGNVSNVKDYKNFHERSV